MSITHCLTSIISAFSFGSGLFIFFKPKSAINIQIKFYKLINWKIEPVSWSKEIRNTKTMGLALLALGLVGLWLAIFTKPLK